MSCYTLSVMVPTSVATSRLSVPPDSLPGVRSPALWHLDAAAGSFRLTERAYRAPPTRRLRIRAAGRFRRPVASRAFAVRPRARLLLESAVVNVALRRATPPLSAPAILRDHSEGTSYYEVRLVFRPQAHLSRPNCTSGPLRASIRLSADFTLGVSSSPRIGSDARDSAIAASRDRDPSAAAPGSVAESRMRQAHPTRLLCGSGLSRTLTSPRTNDSVVRVSRRVVSAGAVAEATERPRPGTRTTDLPRGIGPRRRSSDWLDRRGSRVRVRCAADTLPGRRFRVLLTTPSGCFSAFAHATNSALSDSTLYQVLPAALPAPSRCAARQRYS